MEHVGSGQRSLRTTTIATVLVFLAGLLVVAAATPARAAATTTVASWQMNEPAGATVMVDSGPNGIDGAIGSAVVTGLVDGGVTAYRWPHTAPNQPPPKPERLIQVDDDALNPGTGDFAITIRFRTTHSFGNMIQKGQSNTPGGQFKWQIPNGRLACLFRGVAPDGTKLTKSVNSGTIPLNDGEWHTVRCERTATQLIMTIDGIRTRRANGPTGSISNNVPLTIGGKVNCDQIEITCDYFAGDMDYVLIESSAPPPPPPPGGDIFADDFSNGFTNWTSVTRMSIDETNGNPPPSALVQVAGQSAFATKQLPATSATVCMSFDVNETQLGGNVLMRLRTATNGPVARVVLDSSGRLRVRSDVVGVTGPPTVPLGSGWHSVELCGTVGTSSTWDLIRDGVTILDDWATNTGTTPVGRINLGDTSAKTWSATFDNVVVDQEPG